MSESMFVVDGVWLFISMTVGMYVGWLLKLYVLATNKIISRRRLVTVHTHTDFIVLALLENHAASTMI